MSKLNIPQQNPTPSTPGKSIARSGSSTSLRPVEHTDDLAPMSRSRRTSESSPALTSVHATTPGAPNSAAAQAGLVPLPQGPIQSNAENEALISPVDWKEPDHLKAQQPQSGLTPLHVGKDKKAFYISTASLREKSPYFKKHLPEDASKAQAADATTFEDLDEFAMGLFLHWLTADNKLNGPSDFHSLAHYLSLYVLARKFEVEGLENQGATCR